MTEEQFESEKQYRVQERLGILCGDAVPTPEQLALAEAEAYQWELDYRRAWVKQLQAQSPQLPPTKIT